MHIMFKTHPVVFLPFFQQGLTAISGMLHPPEEGAPGSPNDPVALSQRSMVNQAKQWAICVFDDMIEFCGAQVAWELRSSFWDAMVQGNFLIQQLFDLQALEINTAQMCGRRAATASEHWHTRRFNHKTLP
jgi:hypothetical protein